MKISGDIFIEWIVWYLSKTPNGIAIEVKDFNDQRKILKIRKIKHMFNKNEPQEATLTGALKSWINN